jgi:hypothetical protein
MTSQQQEMTHVSRQRTEFKERGKGGLVPRYLAALIGRRPRPAQTAEGSPWHSSG